MRYKWLLFDADGTLFDFDRSAATSLEQTFHVQGVPFETEYRQIYAAINTEAWRQFEAGEISQDTLRTCRFEKLLNTLNIDGDPEVFSRTYLTVLSEQRHLLPGTAETLAQLEGQVGMVIITNGIADVQHRRFSKSPILSHFSEVFISEEVGAAKPDPKIFEAAFLRLGNPEKSEVLMIGDSLGSDIQGGVNYGIDTCWFNPAGNARPQDLAIDLEIQNLPELIPHLELD